MKKIQLSQTGVEVSCLCLGTLRFGTRNNYEQSAQLMDMYVEAGGDFIDTANSSIYLVYNVYNIDCGKDSRCEYITQHNKDVGMSTQKY